MHGFMFAVGNCVRVELCFSMYACGCLVNACKYYVCKCGYVCI